MGSDESKMRYLPWGTYIGTGTCLQVPTPHKSAQVFAWPFRPLDNKLIISFAFNVFNEQASHLGEEL